ncbi:SAM-dependent methyltransferase [Methylocucumis oryzae]|uniref:Methyltransferase n=1 Tax=Methylocucumis oryzae TaxID=1632867 RepID=A0A0F3IMK7_9GAMM|nr:class I SAM-dependent methyltransferase [Methylocucumis oryzae]KJV07917.1 methyltransferase [Methylocucumis oryzae]
MQASDSATHSVPVAELYDSAEGQLGPILFGGHLHWGFWDADNADDDFAGGSEKLAQLMINKTTIGQDEHFCDLGCGVGLPAIKLAQVKHCYVDGVTISGYQQHNATERAAAAGLQERVNFIHASALSIPKPDLSYDGGWFFESIFHMGHKAALKEAARVLKPGATLLLTDLPLLPTATDDFKQFVKQHIHSEFVTQTDYPTLFAEAGFALVECWDITENVMKPLVGKFKQALEQHKDAVAACADDKAVDNWVYLFEYMSENLGYVLITARKL